MARMAAKAAACELYFRSLVDRQYPICRFGNEDQKQRYLRRSSRGEKINGLRIDGPTAGSNPPGNEIDVSSDGNRFVLNGIKYLISNGGIADAIVVFAYPRQARRRMSASS